MISALSARQLLSAAIPGEPQSNTVVQGRLHRSYALVLWPRRRFRAD